MTGKLTGSGGYNFRSGGHQTGGASVAEPPHPKKTEKGGKEKGGKKEGFPETESGLKRMEIEPAENGHTVSHIYEPSGNDSYKEPSHHVFEHEKTPVALPEGHILHHIAKHLGIPHTTATAASEEGGGEEEE